MSWVVWVEFFRGGLVESVGQVGFLRDRYVKESTGTCTGEAVWQRKKTRTLRRGPMRTGFAVTFYVEAMRR